MNDCFELLICPICREPLIQVERVLKCARNHSFDMAKEGYVNLLPSRKKLAATVGDHAEMLQARRRFLDAGYYAVLSQSINEQVAALLQSHFLHKSAAILDAGCGEGYYLDKLHAHLQKVLPTTHACFLGMDVSKTAVRYAAKRVKNGRFFVANTNTLIPAADQSIDILLNIFAPRNPAEFTRIMAPNGCLFVIIPQPQHLQNIRDQFGLLKIEEDKKENVVTRLSPLFYLNNMFSIKAPVSLSQKNLADLIQMTPNAHHFIGVNREAIKHATYSTEIGFDLMLFTSR
jgi:23S rRNA (guanine745-N1)-methyltransferase